MGTILRTADLIPKPAIPSVIAPNTNTNGQFDIVGILSKINEIATTINKTVEQARMLKELAGGEKKDNIVSSDKKQNIEIVNNTTVKEVYKVKPLDVDKTSMLIEELLKDKARLLPEDIKNMTIGSIIGENFDKFKYEYEDKNTGVEISLNGKSITKLLANGLIKSIEQMDGEQ